MTLTLRYAAQSDRGLIRDGNQDSVYAGPRLLAVAAPTLAQTPPDAAELAGPRDPDLRDNETARGFLGILTAFLYLWHSQDFGVSLDRLLQRTSR